MEFRIFFKLEKHYSFIIIIIRIESDQKKILSLSKMDIINFIKDNIYILKI